VGAPVNTNLSEQEAEGDHLGHQLPHEDRQEDDVGGLDELVPERLPAVRVRDLVGAGGGSDGAGGNSTGWALGKVLGMGRGRRGCGCGPRMGFVSGPYRRLVELVDDGEVEQAHEDRVARDGEQD
jgi:hypothetical protein